MNQVNFNVLITLHHLRSDCFDLADCAPEVALAEQGLLESRQAPVAISVPQSLPLGAQR